MSIQTISFRLKVYYEMLIEMVTEHFDRHVKTMVRPNPKFLSPLFAKAIEWSTVDGKRVPCAIEVTLHGFYAHAAMCGDYAVEVLPALSVDTEFFDDEVTRQIEQTIHRIVASYHARGFYLVPTKISLHKANFLMFVHKKSPLGKKIDALTFDQKFDYYMNTASICQYGFQPFDRLRKGVQVVQINEPSLKLYLSEFKSLLKRKLGVLPDWFDAKKSVTVPFGDGQLYAGPNSTVWTLAPSIVNNMPRYKMNTLKVIGVMKNNPFVFIKGVIIRLSVREWAEKCKIAGVNPDFDGLIVNQHAVKNKLKFDLSQNITFNLGYHADSRMYMLKSQIFGSQAFFRSHNLNDRSRYWTHVTELVSNFDTTIRNRDVPGFIRLVAGDPKVFEDTPYYRSILGRAAIGLPLTMLDRMNSDGGIRESVKNMIIKRVGRPKVSKSFRAMPADKRHIFTRGRKVELDINQCGLTPAQARNLGVSTGDTIMMIRSPKSTGFPNLVLEVVSIHEKCFSINTTLYQKWNQGDVDGDSVAVYRNEGIVESTLKMEDILRILFEEEDPELVSTLETVTENAWQTTSIRQHLSDLMKTLWGSVIGPKIQSLIAKAATGAYDNFASRLLYKNMHNHHMLRVFWNRITQLCITNMKHVGDAIPSPLEMAIQLRDAGIELEVLTDIHYLLTANRGRFEEARDHVGKDGVFDRRTTDPMKANIVDTYLGIDMSDMIDSERKYEVVFEKHARNAFFNWARGLSAPGKKVISEMMAVDEDGCPLYKTITTRNGRRCRVISLKDNFDIALNGSDRVFNEKFNLLTQTIDSISKGNINLKQIAWRAVFNIALFESFKSWLLTRPFDKEVETEISRLISHIAVPALQELGVEPRARLVYLEQTDLEHETEPND